MASVPITSRHQFIPLAKLSASPLNHRKTFDATKMAELTESVRSKGILQPILARPLGEAFEVVAGERRFRAAKAAKLVDIPAIVREMNDTEALELQVIENGQRVDPHPLEEAEGYEALMQCKDAGGERYTAEQIAAKVGKSRSYIFERVKLLALCPEGRKAFYAGDLDVSKALLIARIGHHDTQRQALKDITGGRFHNGDPMSYRDAHRHVLDNYMLKLSMAPFDIKDAELLAKAGACPACPKRTGNQADLFQDVKSADVCTDPKCFDDKRQAHFGIAAKALEADGYKVITGDAAKKILPHWEHHRGGGQYIQLSGGYEGFQSESYASGRRVKVSSLFDKDYKPAKLQHPLTGEFIDVVTQQAVAAAAQKSKKTKAHSGASTNRKARVPQQKPEEMFRERLFATICAKLPAEIGREDLRVLAKESLLTMSLDHELELKVFFPTKAVKKGDERAARRAVESSIATADVATLSRIVLASLFGEELSYVYGQPKKLLEAAKRYRVDPAQVKRAIADEAKAKVAEEAKAKRDAKAAKKVKKPKAAKASGGMAASHARAEKGKAKRAVKRGPMAAFMKPMQPSAALALIVGDKPLPRTEVTSKLWGYIKKHDLQDKVNRRMINSDEKLLPILGKKQVSMFEMTKLMVKHLTRA